jgi:hypothetical protein
MTEPYPVTRPVVDLGFAQLDVERAARTGDPEVVNGTGKTPEQVVAALRELHRAHAGRAVLGTRLAEPALARCRAELPAAELDELARVAVLGTPVPARGRVAVVGAVRVFGATPEIVVDVGVAGLHRLLARRETLADADVVVAVAGMEAALPSVIGGLVGTTLIAVPTSVGYGWHLDGLTAWLAMLNSCAPGVLTVNVDNGFGAGVAAARIARRVGAAERPPAEGSPAERPPPAERSPGERPPGERSPGQRSPGER